MRKNGPNVQICETVTGMDLLVSKVGERDGGIVREEHFEVLEEKMRWLLYWNLDLRRFGFVPHAGWGLGFERLSVLNTRLDDTREIIPLPHFQDKCNHLLRRLTH
ncbi:hypothetical protein CCR75_003615 [Bremia lactucae]|uniref:Aminoacyl-tRNA synthetase class II (D/K/N) domain-containing protein n=1 Tax=Bremia lactucae TaxID=4779 RepID=A0A976FFF2_BRELC|nr:hypothetical protein CCR75_003615 [Bremia lactucae]